ncbi:hypothetical protein CC86DRAFT_349195 [Ophiobolus disseminans]|uniref:HNH domain-containing protein n=1 Tax=Ophiobolus disseminans TaxID=1469910 RepID=A0A6A7A2Q6_9PLEO|nr:hypothetical protein CC86DRAFT_349195 [Ophiobolus disseminans]
MAEAIPLEEQSNYETFRDCLSEPVLRSLAISDEKPKPKKKRHAKKNSKEKNGVERKSTGELEIRTSSNGDTQPSDAEDLGEFIEYLSTLIFPSLPPSLRTLSHPKFRASPSLQDTYSTPLSASTYTPVLDLIPPTAVDSLESSALLPIPSDTISLRNLLLPVLNAYVSATTAPPPIWTTTRTTNCELCQRDWVPLTYHHLIPKAVHARVLKRGWHTEDKLNSVAWLCRACHSFVHRLASNEGLARGFYTLDLIREGGVEGDSEKKGEVERWVGWVGGVRWRSK